MDNEAGFTWLLEEFERYSIAVQEYKDGRFSCNGSLISERKRCMLEAKDSLKLAFDDYVTTLLGEGVCV